VNETTAETQTASDALVARQLQHVGAAYGLIFLLIFVFAWRATTAAKRLGERLDELERDSGRSR
jgi:hypothetical protein